METKVDAVDSCIDDKRLDVGENGIQEVIDIACYVEHNGSGEKHIACAKMCMENGLPVGIKANDGKTYLLVGDHKSLNKELVEFAGKTITMKGHAVSRDGINLIADAEIVK